MVQGLLANILESQDHFLIINPDAERKGRDTLVQVHEEGRAVQGPLVNLS